MMHTKIDPVYQQFPGWKMDSSALKDVQKLPEQMKSYISFINDHLSEKVHYISNGPGRDQIIKLNA